MKRKYIVAPVDGLWSVVDESSVLYTETNAGFGAKFATETTEKGQFTWLVVLLMFLFVALKFRAQHLHS